MDDMNEDAPTDMSVKEEQTRYAETTETDGMNQEAQFADVSSKADEQTGTVETSDQTETRDTDGMAENAQPNVPQKAEEQKRHAETAEVNGMNQEALTEVPSKTDEQTRTFKISGPMVDSWLKIGTDEGLASDALIAGFLLEQ
nr:hypothetical protein BaRGS_010990 [Batillaria attramentaria]